MTNQDAKAATRVLYKLARNGGTRAECRALIADGGDVNIHDMRGQTALMWAACNGFVDIVQALIDGGADVNAQNSGGKTALMKAVEVGANKCTQVLLDAGADINVQEKTGCTVLMLAILRSGEGLIHTLLAREPDMLLTSIHGKSAVDMLSSRELVRDIGRKMRAMTESQIAARKKKEIEDQFRAAADSGTQKTRRIIKAKVRNRSMCHD